MEYHFTYRKGAGNCENVVEFFGYAGKKIRSSASNAPVLILSGHLQEQYCGVSAQSSRKRLWI